jgi:glycosyltransferase involved in cell wall biosynthesis
LLKTSAKIVKEFHFSKFYCAKAKKNLFKKFENYLESKLDFSVVLSEEERQFYTTNNIVVIPNPVPEIQEKIKLTARKNIAMAAGRLAPVKRFDVLIAIWGKFVAANPNSHWKLQIYGGGEDAYVDSLKQMIINKKLTDHIFLMGSVTHINNIMQSAGLYLMTSAQECFPMVLLEAQAAGLPIISFDCPTGPRNIINNNHNGVLVENDNQEAFVSELQKLVTNEEDRTLLAKNGIVNAQNYTLEKIMTIWDRKIINN